MINVLIADDQNFFRKTLESYLKSESDLNVIGFAENGETALKKVETLKPDVVLMDIEMPIMDGLTATKNIVERFSETKVLILTTHDRDRHLAQALKLGARGYWFKNTTAKELATAIRYVHQGYFQLALELVEKLIHQTITLNSELKPGSELNNQLDIVDTVLAKIEQKIGPLEELTPQSLNETVENIVKQEMSRHQERDANYQFKLDRLKHRLTRIENKNAVALKAQLIYNLILALAVLGVSCFLFIKQ